MEKNNKIVNSEVYDILSRNISVIFRANKSPMNKTIKEVANKYNDKIKQSEKLYPEAIRAYKTIIKNTASFIAKLGLKNNPHSYFAIFYQLLTTGRLSVADEFFFSENGLMDVNGYSGIDVILGQGCCRSVCDMLNRIFKELGYESMLLPTSIVDEKYINPIGEHAVILVNHNDNYYIYDPVYFSVYKLDKQLIASSYFDEDKIVPQLPGLMLTEQMEPKKVKNLYYSMSNQKQDKYINKSEMEAYIVRSIDIYNNSIKELEKFYFELCDNGVELINNLELVFNTKKKK